MSNVVTPTFVNLPAVCARTCCIVENQRTRENKNDPEKEGRLSEASLHKFRAYIQMKMSSPRLRTEMCYNYMKIIVVGMLMVTLCYPIFIEAAAIPPEVRHNCINVVE